MQHQVTLEQNEIRDAIREYVEKQTGKTVTPNSIEMHFTRGMGPAEQDQFSATAMCA